MHYRSAVFANTDRSRRPRTPPPPPTPGRTSCCASPTTGRGPTPGRTATRSSRRRRSTAWPARGCCSRRAFCAAPSCTPSRASILTGQAPHRLEEGRQPLGHRCRAKFPVYPDLLEAAGYFVGLHGQGVGPGRPEGSGRTRNPAGPAFKSFEQFLKAVPPGKPFCFWFGSHDPHRPYEGQGVEAGHEAGGREGPAVPARHAGGARRHPRLLLRRPALRPRQSATSSRQIEAAGRLDNTLVVMTSDNGMPFPRGQGEPVRRRHPHAAGRPLAGAGRRRGGRSDALVVADRPGPDVPRGGRAEAGGRTMTGPQPCLDG